MTAPWEWATSPRLDHAAAAALVAHHLGLPERDRLTPLGEGDSCLAFSDGDVIVRVAKHADAAAGLRREACLLPQIGRRLPVAIPQPTYFEPSACPPFTVHEAIRGEVLTPDSWRGLPPAGQERLTWDLAAFLDALHALPVAAGRRCGLLPIDLRETARWLHHAAPPTLRGLLDGETLTRLEAVFAQWSPPAAHEPVPPALLHRDVGPDHVLFCTSTVRLSGVIDFGDLAVGDPARDFIGLYEDYGSEFMALVLRGYAREGAASLLPRVRAWYLFEAISWTMQMYDAGDTFNVARGIDGITRELDPSRDGR